MFVLIDKCDVRRTKINVKFTIQFPTRYLGLFYLERSVLLTAVAVVSRSFLLMDLVVTEKVVFRPVTVSAPQSRRSL